MDRRSFLSWSGTAAAALALSASTQTHEHMQIKIKAILFDGFAIFDSRSVAALAMRLYPEKGNDLVREWRIRQFEYSWLRTLSNSYLDFLTIIGDALVFAADLLQIKMTRAEQDQLVDGYYHLRPWPGVPEMLMKLKTSGYRLGVLSNFTGQMLNINVANGHLEGLFEQLISVETVMKYKPDPATYQMGMKAFHLSRGDILFVPFAGWDAAGAKTFGYTTFWANYLQSPVEELGAKPDGIGKDINDLWAYLKTGPQTSASTLH